MGSTNNKCSIKGCKKNRRIDKNGHSKSKFCTTHATKATINAFLGKTYRDMRSRVNGTNKGSVADRSRYLYVGKSILPRDVFMTWSKNHPDFLNMYKRYVMNDFERKLAPSVNRIDSDKGYILGNMEWMTTSQNCSLAGSVRNSKSQEKRAIYRLLGVNK